MSDNTKVAEAAPDAEKGTAAPADPVAPQDKKKTDAEPDWKSELEKTRAELGQAQHVIKTLKQKKGKDGKAEVAQDVDPEDPDAEPERKIEEVVAEQIGAIRSDLLGDVVDDEIGKLTANPDLQKLVRLHYERSIRHSGANRAAVQADVRNAFAIANRPVLERIGSEAARAAESDAAKGSGYAGTHRVDRSGDELTSVEKAQIASIAKRTGASVEQVTARFLANKSGR